MKLKPDLNVSIGDNIFLTVLTIVIGFSKKRNQKKEPTRIPGISTNGPLKLADNGSKLLINIPINGQSGTWSKYKL